MATFTHIDTRYYSSKDKQKTPYKKQKTASSYKILPLNGLMTVWGLRRFCSLPLSTNSIEYDFFENDFSKYVFAKHNVFMNALQGKHIFYAFIILISLYKHSLQKKNAESAFFFCKYSHFANSAKDFCGYPHFY